VVAGFQVIIGGRFWVITEVTGVVGDSSRAADRRTRVDLPFQATLDDEFQWNPEGLNRTVALLDEHQAPPDSDAGPLSDFHLRVRARGARRRVAIDRRSTRAPSPDLMQVLVTPEAAALLESRKGWWRANRPATAEVAAFVKIVSAWGATQGKRPQL
jgi:hypothetical protein